LPVSKTKKHAGFDATEDKSGDFFCAKMPFLVTFCDISRSTGEITPFGVFSDAFPGHKMQVHVLTAPGILVICEVTYPSTNWDQRCLSLAIQWTPVCPTWEDAEQLP
jgi:hypothetical protein